MVVFAALGSPGPGPSPAPRAADKLQEAFLFNEDSDDAVDRKVFSVRSLVSPATLSHHCRRRRQNRTEEAEDEEVKVSGFEN